MILKNNDYLNIIKKLRKEIVKQSELPPENVLNALSDNGTRLSQIINETITNSFESTDSFIIFELIEDTSSSTLIATDDDGGESIVPYNFNLKYEEEFLNYRKVMENEDCVKVCADIKRVQVKATSEIKNCYIH